ncbi:hypothetical protein C1J03_01385 [Sulfitobacter sp. SK012]|uniref:NYN domain-containing protein n=1 Tax=Sulfitobacter sp. SK012 TaxID=1389005 RepID=UPI000E0AEF9B|nr:hypothetical protein [Sulfitobacter sp. SK012]AXI44800.1 hypothetical protein C1J03_01385 [Sulfitobacter sp. SK012]
MTPLHILMTVTAIFAIIGYIASLRLQLWITLIATAALASYFFYVAPLDQTNAPYWIGATTFILICIAAARRGRTLPAPRPRKTENGIIVDGTNVLYWDDQTPQLDTLRAVVADLKRRDLVPTVFLDASSRHHLKDTTLNEKRFAHALGLSQRAVMVCPAGTEADVFILKHARSTGQPILSNDRFGDRAQQRKGLRIIKGVIANGRPVFDGI